MQQIIINADFGGFGISEHALELYKILSGIPPIEKVDSWEISRDDAILVQIVEQLGESANTSYSALKVVEIPDDVEWHIESYDGLEHIAENHRTWR
jgi:hypothetical protein